MKPTLQRWVLGFAGLMAASGCVDKPGFHCATDDACVTSDGRRGLCSSGVCDFTGLGQGAAGSAVVSDASGVSSEAASQSYTPSYCVPFDNASRLTKLTDTGDLPSLPEITQ